MTDPAPRTPPRSTERELRRLEPLLRLMSAVDRAPFQWTGGRVGGWFLRGAPVGLLTTTGRAGPSAPRAWAPRSERPGSAQRAASAAMRSLASTYSSTSL